MSIFNHELVNVKVETEILEREMQKTYLEGLLNLRREELDADFNNLINSFNESIDEDLCERLKEFESSLSRFLEVRSELFVTRDELEYAMSELTKEIVEKVEE